MGSRWGHSSEEPVHEVCIPFDFYLGQFPVTQQQFAVWTNATDLDHKNRFAGNDNNPAESMNWDESVQFCAWLGERYAHYQSKEETWPSDYQCALPSEAQWEYACSAWGEIENNAGSVNRVYTEYHSGDGEAALHQAGWYGNNSDSHPPVVTPTVLSAAALGATMRSAAVWRVAAGGIPVTASGSRGFALVCFRSNRAKQNNQ